MKRIKATAGAISPKGAGGSFPARARLHSAVLHRAFPSFRFFTLRFNLVEVGLADEFALEINGRPIPAERMSWLYAANGRDERFRARPLGPYGLYMVSLKAEELVRGRNVLVVRLVKRNPALLGSVELMEVEVRVLY